MPQGRPAGPAQARRRPRPWTRPGVSSAGEGRQDLDRHPVGQRRRPAAAHAVHQEAGDAEHPAQLLAVATGRVVEDVAERAAGVRLLAGAGGRARCRPVADRSFRHRPRASWFRRCFRSVNALAERTYPTGRLIIVFHGTADKEGGSVAQLLLLTDTLQPSTEVLPALGLLSHGLRVAPAEVSALLEAPRSDAILVDGRRDLPHVRSLCRVLRTTGVDCPVVLVTTEGALAAVTAEWGVDDVILEDAGPAEVEARLRLAMGRLAARTGAEDEVGEIRRGDVTIDEATYTARVKGRVLDLTFKEFELLKFLAQHPGRVFSRAQLLQEVWGYDYYGGTRTVDVHVRRLRAKLGSDHETLIGTVRNVGYRFVLPKEPQDPVPTDLPAPAPVA